MKRYLTLLLITLLTISLAACSTKEDTATPEIPTVEELPTDDTLKEEMYFAMVPDSYFYIPNQTANLTLERSLFINSNDEYEPYYYEMILEPIAPENIAIFTENQDNIKAALVKIYNDTMANLPDNGSGPVEITEDAFADVDFALDLDGSVAENEAYLISYRRVDINYFDAATIQARIMQEGESCDEDYSACLFKDTSGTLRRFFSSNLNAKEVAIDYDYWLGWTKLDENEAAQMEGVVPEGTESTEPTTPANGN